MLQPRIQTASAIVDLFHQLQSKTDIFYSSPAIKKAGKKLSQPAAVRKVNDAIFKKLYLDVILPTQLKNIKRSVHQSIRLAQLDALIGQTIFSHCNALLTPMATFGCVSVCRHTGITVFEDKITHSSSGNTIEGIILQCAFCDVSIPFAKMISCFTLSGSPKCTMELLATLSEEHKAECRGLKGADRMNEEEMQFGVSEGGSDVINSTSTLQNK